MEALEQLTMFSEQGTVISVSGNREQLKIRNLELNLTSVLKRKASDNPTALRLRRAG